MVLFLMGTTHSLAQPGPDDVVGAEARKADVAFLDSLLGPRMTASIQDAAGLAARNALVDMMLKAGDVQRLEWALAVHGWLRIAGDAHMRVPFDRLTELRTHVPVPDPPELLDPEGLWSRFGPGESVAPSARAAWLARTWSWVGVLGSNGGEADVAPSVQAVSSGMTIEDHGAFQRWVIPSFGSGNDRQFIRSFRRCVRRLRRADSPVMVDLRGNLGGYRTRRHAVLGALFLRPRGLRSVKGHGRWLGALMLCRPCRLYAFAT